jgi:hypothetical protein
MAAVRRSPLGYILPSISALQRLLASLREVNPLWVIAAAALLLALLAGSSMHQHVRDSARLQQRLTGMALVDALKLYAEATGDGQSSHPASVAELIDDNRDGKHRNWLDAASAEALADRSEWELISDAQGRVRGARLRTAVAAGSGMLPSWLGGGTAQDKPTAYAVDELPAASAPASTPAAPDSVPLALPQPVMPDTQLAPLQAQAEARQPPKTSEVGPTLAAAPGEPHTVAAPDVLDPLAKPSKGDSTLPPSLALKPSRILAGLEARQVLRLSSSDSAEAPVLTPRRIPQSPGIPGVATGGRTAAVGAVTGSNRVATSAAASKNTPTAPAGATSAAPGATGPATGGVPAVIAPAQPLSPGASAAKAPPARAASRTRLPSSPGRTAAQGALHRARPAPSPATTPMPPDRPTVSPPLPVAALPPASVPTSGAPPSVPVGNAAPPALVNVVPPVSPAAVQPPLPARMDTVIYEDNQGSSQGDAPKTDCRALAGDSSECDTYEDSDPALYQRCYQSLSERINACIAGDPIPPLVTR